MSWHAADFQYPLETYGLEVLNDLFVAQRCRLMFEETGHLNHEIAFFAFESQYSVFDGLIARSTYKELFYRAV